MSKITQLIDELRLNKCSIKLNGIDKINLILEDKAELSEELIAKVKKNKLELIDYLKFSLQTVELRIEKVATQANYPISNAQRRLWVLSQFEEGSVAYNIPGSTYLNQDIDIDYFKRAIDSTIERHEILRTVFKEDETGEIRQWILTRDDLGFKIDYKDFRKEENKEEKVKNYIAEDSYKLFDLENGPLLRAALLQIEDEAYVFNYSMHHIISDGWSMEVLAKDVFSYYDAYKENKQPALKELRIQYKDYSAWALAQLGEESFKTHRAYWLTSLEGDLPLLDLPGTKQRPRIKTHNGHGLSAYIDSTTTSKLKKYSEANGGSLFMGLLAAWNILMYRYTGQKDIIIGTPIAGREHADLEDQIGFYVNTLALRNEIKPEESFNAFYSVLKDNTLKSYSHQMYPFDRLVEELDLQRDTSRSAVFDLMLVLQNNGEKAKGVELSKEELNRIVDLGHSTSKFDIDIAVQEIGDYLSLQVVYNPDVYEREMVEGLINHYRQLLKALLKSPEEKISQIDYLSQAEKHELLFTFNDTKVDYPKDKTLVDLFEEQAAKTPDNIALVFEEKELTYRELNEESNQLAHYLQKNYKIKADDLVGIKQDRSEWMIISILGVLKSGGAYVPIDPEYPQDRIDYIEEDTKCKVCIDENELSKFIKSQAKYSKKKIPSLAKPGNLAYVIYTSGSTGKPKGVMVEHRNAVRLFKADNPLFDFNDSDVWTMFHSYAFDFSVWEMYGALLFGGKLILVPKLVAQDTSLYLELIEREGVTVLNQTPSAFYNLSKEEKKSKGQLQVRYVIFGGEALSPDKLQHWRDRYPSCKLINMYGITETTVHTTYKEISQEDITLNRSNIGKAIPTVSCIVLDENKNLVPSGIRGELYIGGEGVARGYLNREELTNERFIANPFAEGEKLYRTGDKVKQLINGDFEYLGRVDDQVKIRGYRIELGEIEHALLKNQQIKEAVVLAKENQNNEKELVAYITAKAQQNTSELRSYLKEFLPDYMLPAYYVQLEVLPLTSNGKIDKKSLPDPQGLGLASGIEYVAPRTEQERVLAWVWSDVLKREGIGIKDSFYNLGGDSIKSIQVVARLKQKGYTLKVEHLLRTPVLEELSRLMQQTTQITDQSEVKGLVELTPIQKWFFEDPIIKVHNHFNQSVLLQSKEELDKALLEKSISALTKHHDALRMVYKKAEGAWEQINQDSKSKSYTIDFFDLSQADNAQEQMSKVGEELQSSIKLSEGPLFRVVHFRLKDGDRLGLIIHHLVIDGVSWRILLEDLSSLYTSYKEGKKSGLALKTDSFQRWAMLQKQYAEGRKLQKERTYWEELCNETIEKLPQDKKIKASDPITIDSSESFSLDKRTTELLQTRVHGVYNTEINDVLLTGLGLAIKEVLSREKSVLKMEGHGREEIIDGVDISRTVGWFTSMYPFVLDVSKSASGTESLVGVKEALRRVPNKGIGYGILKHLSQEGIDNNLTPEILFNYLGDFGTNAGNAENSLFEYASEYIGSTSKENGNDAILDVSGMLVMGKLSMSISYSQGRYDSKTIKKLIKSYEKNLKSIIEELSKKKETYLTPSDLSFKGLSAEELSKINSDGTVEDVYELSPLQEGIYYHWLSEESNSLYFEQMSYRVSAKGLDIKNLKGAYDGLIARHGVLRTSFSNDYAGRCLQIVRKAVPSNFSYEKIENQQDKEDYVQQIKQKDRARGFDLSSSSQMRLHIIDLSEGEYEFIWSHHHILMDGWCMSVLINDFNQLLNLETMGSTLDLAPVIPYSNYINWLKEIDKESSLAYWKGYLADYSQVAEIPFKIKTEEKTYIESKEHLQIEGELFKKVDALCNQTGITHNTFIQGVWGYLLSRYNNTNDVVFGAVVSGRPAELQGVEDMIGLFINTIPVRVKYESKQSPVELLKALQEESIQSTSHHYMNLSEVQSQSEPGMNLINHIMVFENYAVKELTDEGVLNTQREEGISIESMEVFEQTNYDFSITIGPSSTSLSINIKYNTNRYDSSSLKRLKNHFDNLISAFTENADQPLNTFNYLSEAEKQELLVTLNDTKVDYPKDKTIVDLFEEQVEKTPYNVAVVFEEKELSYKELNEQSNQLAAYLQKNYDIKPDDLVGIKQDRSEWMIISILGVLKSGGAYVPIDPEYPQDRIDYIEKDTKCKVCIDENELAKFKKSQKKYSKEKITSLTKADNLVYVIYTSGSTGRPKGVMVNHYNVVRLFKNDDPLFDFNSSDVWTMFHSYAFDFSVWEMYGALLFGGKLILVPKLVAQDTSLYLELIEREGVTVLNQTPSAFYNLSKEDQEKNKAQLQVRYVIFGGEALSPGKLQHWKDRHPSCKLINMYGITETTVHTTYKEITQEDITLNRSNIGKAIPTVSCIVLDENKNLVPSGIRGELYIGGEGVARGYLNREELTNERFIANPFAEGKLYRTGDKVKQLINGDFEYLGRVDEQVKIRGYRIELGEIEHALRSHKEIEEAVVLGKENKNNEKELVAYITAKAQQNTSELRSYLKEILPEYMLPAYYVQLKELPLTSNGKIDKKSLPDPQGLGLTSGVEYVAPRNEIEQKLVKIWQEVLRKETEKIGIDEGFFVAGGNSLKLIALKSKIEKEFKVHCPVASLFQFSTIRLQADMLFKENSIETTNETELDNLASVFRGERNGESSNDIAVIGMSIKAPGAKNIHEFWGNLRNGRESITNFSEEELLSFDISKNELSNKNYVRANSYLEDKECFDSNFFGYLPDEAKLMDPQTRVFHEVVWSALEDSGYDPLNYKGLIGLYAGAGSNLEWEAYSQLSNEGKIDGFTASNLSNKDFSNTLIAHKLNLKGPVNSINTACSTSLVAIHQAVISLLSGENKIAIAGGVSINNRRKEGGYLYQEGMILSKDGHNRTFDSDSSGTVGGEGAGAVVLKKLSTAIEDGDQIYAIIKGSAINNDGNRKVGYTAPSVDGQSEVIRLAHKVANISPGSVSYVEAHGTATKLGDPIEVLALTKAFGKSVDKYCALGSVKTNIGHLDSAAGVAGFIKTVLCLKNKELVPSLHFKSPNPEINFEESPFYVNTELKAWPGEAYPRRAGVSSFGIGGTNAHVILEEIPAVLATIKEPSLQLITLSAKTSAALARQQENLTEFLKENKDVNLVDVAWTLQNRRSFSYRSSFVAQTIDQAIECLKKTEGTKSQNGSLQGREKKIAFMFSGQGSQYENMGRGLYEVEESVFRKTIDHCFEIAEKLTDIDFKNILYPVEQNKNNPINETINTQPILFMFEYSLAKQMEYYGITPDIIIGHSIGEYVAACIGEVLTLEGALKMVIKRAELMQALPKGAMLAVGISAEKIEDYLSKDVNLAAVNTPESCVISGDIKLIANISKRFEKEGIPSKLLRTSHAFHSVMMEPMLDKFIESIGTIKINSPRIPYISNLTAQKITEKDLKQKTYWSDHIRGTVNFSAGIDEILSEDNVVFIEIGPGNTLSNFARQHFKDNKSSEVHQLIRHDKTKEDDTKFLLNKISDLWRSGLEIDWVHLQDSKVKHKLSLPTYSFEKTKYPVGGDAFRMISERLGQLNEERRLDESKWYYEPFWKSSKLRLPSNLNQGEDWYLIFCDEGDISQSLIRLPEMSANKIVIVKSGSKFKKTNDREFELNPYDYEGYEKLFNELKIKKIHPTHIIHLLSLDQNLSRQIEQENVEKNKVFGFYSLLHIARELNKNENQLPVNLSVITNHLESVFNDDVIYPSKALMLGISTVITQENPLIQSRLIDLALENGEKGINDLVKEIKSVIGEKLIAYRNNIRWVKDYNSLSMPSSESENKSKIKTGGTYLITGGLGGLGFIYAKYLIEKYKANLVLIGRSELSTKDLEKASSSGHAIKNKDQEKKNRLQLLQNSGNVLYHNANVSDLLTMQKVIEKAGEKFGKIDGVIHAAGVVEGNSFSGINFLSLAECEKQFEPKITGAHVIEEIFKNNELDFCLFTSSLSSIIGGKEFGAYASANAYLDYFSRKGVVKNSITVNFDGLNFNEEIKVESALNPLEIIKIFEAVLLTKDDSQIIVSLTELKHRIEKWVYPKFDLNNEIQNDVNQVIPADIERSNLSTIYFEPESKTEKELCQMFQSFFGIREVGIDDDFFELGGDSLKIMTLISRIHQKLNIQLRIKDVLEHPNIRDLGKEIDLLTSINQMQQERALMNFKNKIEL